MRADVVNRENIRVIERGGRARLLLEAAQPLRVGQEFRRQQLDRDVTLEPRVVRAIHLAHSSGPDEGLDAIGTERRPRFEMA